MLEWFIVDTLIGRRSVWAIIVATKLHTIHLYASMLHEELLIDISQDFVAS